MAAGAFGIGVIILIEGRATLENLEHFRKVLVILLLHRDQCLSPLTRIPMMLKADEHIFPLRPPLLHLKVALSRHFVDIRVNLNRVLINIGTTIQKFKKAQQKQQTTRDQKRQQFEQLQKNKNEIQKNEPARLATRIYFYEFNYRK